VILRRIEALTAAIPQLEIETLSRYPGLDTDPQAEVVKLVRGLSGAAAPIKVAFGTEAGFLSDLGIPTVICGPGSMEGQGHKPDEYLARDQLDACDRMLAALLDQLC